MGTLALQVAIAGVVFIAFGVFFKTRSDDWQTYQTKAQTTGIDPGRIKETYQGYRHNRAYVGNIAIWLGIGCLVASVFDLI